MYKILADGETIHNPALNDDTRLVVDAKISQKINMADALEFTIYPNNAGAASIHKLTTTIEVYQDDLLLFRGRPIQSKTGWENQVTYTCEGGLAVLNDTIVRPYSFTGSVRDYLQQLITQHNNQVPAAKQITLRTVTVTDPNNTIVRSNSDYVMTMQEIQNKLVENLGGYLVLSYDAQTGWILDYLAASPRATGQAITLAKNLLDMLREQNAENIATALIPLGAVDEETGERITIRTVNGGQDYIVDQTAAARYGLIFTTETWDDVTIPANLLRKAQARLTDYATMIPTIKLTAVDLSAIDPDLDPIRILDEVTVQDDKHEASGVYLVAERTYDLSAPERDTVTFGGDLPSITKTSAKTAAAVQDIPAQVLQTASDRTRAILDAATDGAIQILYNSDGVAYELRINNSQNPATATKWWRYNSAGWGYTADGGQTYTIAATMDGAFLANFITAGVLRSQNGKFSLDMETGTANLANANITGGSIAYRDANYVDINNDGIFGGNNDFLSEDVPLFNLTVEDSEANIRYGKLELFDLQGGLNDYPTIEVKGSGEDDGAGHGEIRINAIQDSAGLIALVHKDTHVGQIFLMNGATAQQVVFVGANATTKRGLLYLNDEYGDRIATLGATAAGYGSLSLGDGYHTRCILNDGGVYWYDANGTIRCRINPTGGLYFFNSSGTLTKSYPAT